MKVSLEYNLNDPEDVILAERIIKCNAMASVLWNLYVCDKKDFTKEFLEDLLHDKSVDIQRIYT